MLKSIYSINFKETSNITDNKNLSKKGNNFLPNNETANSLEFNKLLSAILSKNAMKNLGERLLIQDLLIHKKWPNLEAFGGELIKSRKFDLLNIFPKLSDHLIFDLHSYISSVNEKTLLTYFKQNESLFSEIPSQIVNAFYEDLIILDKMKNDITTNNSWLVFHLPINGGKKFYMTNIFYQRENVRFGINKMQRFIVEFTDDYLGEIQIDGMQYFSNDNLEKVSMYFRSDRAISNDLKSEIKRILKSNFDNFGVDFDLKMQDLHELKQDHIKDIIQEFNISL